MHSMIAWLATLTRKTGMSRRWRLWRFHIPIDYYRPYEWKRGNELTQLRFRRNQYFHKCSPLYCSITTR